MRHPCPTALRLALAAVLGAFGAGPAAAVPQVMLVLAKDEPWFQEAYPATADIDGDGTADPTYRDDLEYTGYFHPRRCYRYQDAPPTQQALFAPVGAAGGLHQHHCTGALDDAWSGNFLNWATMTRIDLLRQAMYGGYRAALANGDTAASTILERAHLPGDGHAFAKYYNGADIDGLVPFANLKVDQANGGDADGVDDPDEGITLCNVSYKASGSSQGATGATPVEVPNPAPMLRVVRENHQLWDMNERRQCTWENEHGDNANGNSAAESGLLAAGTDPASAKELHTPNDARDHLVRVRACDPAFVDLQDNPETCTTYAGNLKPAGLLQQRGLAEIEFGLVTTSYAKNLSGGVLRKRIGLLGDEIDATTGTFVPKSGNAPGIIRTLNAVRVFGYAYNGGTYGADLADRTAGGEDCTFQLTTFAEGRCRSWGNPVAELYLEALRYFAVDADRGPTPAFDAADGTSLAGLVQDSWTPDPFLAAGERPSWNVLLLSAAPNSFDGDQTTHPLFGDVVAATNAIGVAEQLESTVALIGRTATDANEFCTPKTLGALGVVRGPCPGQPTAQGSYHVAGLAHYAKTHDLRPTLGGEQRVRTFAIELPPRAPTLDVPIGARTIRLTPAYRLRQGGNNASEGANTPGNDGGGTLLRFKVAVAPREVVDPTSVQPASGTGHFYAKFVLAWDDSEQGADFDQDVWGTLEYRVDETVNPATIRVFTKTVAQSTAPGQLFGFVIEGTTQDGFHAFSGVQGGNYFAGAGADPQGVPGCSNCRALSEAGGQRGTQTFTFTVSATSGAPRLQAPLFYASKWGGFRDFDGDLRPGQPGEWDTFDAAGQPAPAGDGIPDTYFPLAHAGHLRRALDVATTRILTDALTCAECPPDFDGDGLADAVDPDDDNDGLPDQWESGFGLDPRDPADAADDPDQDGASNLQEFARSTDPTFPTPTGATGFDFEDAVEVGLAPVQGFLHGSGVPPAAQVGAAYAARGLVADGVAVVIGGAGHAASGEVMLAGVRQQAIDYTAPFTFTFVSPVDGRTPAVTDYFSLSGDRAGGSGNAVRLQAYGADGTLLGTREWSEEAGPTRFVLSDLGMFRSVVVTPLVTDPSSGGIGFDLLVLGALSPLPPAPPAEIVPLVPPAALAALLAGLGFIARRRLGRERGAADYGSSA